MVHTSSLHFAIQPSTEFSQPVSSLCYNLVHTRDNVIRDGKMERWRDGEMERWGDGEMGRWGDGEIEAWRLIIPCVRNPPISLTFPSLTTHHWITKYKIMNNCV